MLRCRTAAVSVAIKIRRFAIRIFLDCGLWVIAVNRKNIFGHDGHDVVLIVRARMLKNAYRQTSQNHLQKVRFAGGDAHFKSAVPQLARSWTRGALSTTCRDLTNPGWPEAVPRT